MTIGKFLDPKNDWAFKHIFGTEKNKDILIHFLNDVFVRTTNPIEEVTFLKTNQDPEVASKRQSIVDILCKDLRGEHFIIEMQVARDPGFERRAQYYAARTYIDQRDKGIDYKNLKAVIFLAITNFIVFPDKSGYISYHKILDEKTLENDLKDFSFSFIELPKFRVSKGDLKTMIQKWFYFLKNAPETNPDDLREIIGSDIIIERAYHELDRLSWSLDEARMYTCVDMKTQAERDGREEAFDEGKAEGGYRRQKRARKRNCSSTNCARIFY